MKQFIYDEAGLKDLLSLAYEHGYEHGTRDERSVTHEGLEKQIMDSSLAMDIGRILGGGEPSIWENVEKSKQFYDQCDHPSRSKWFIIGGVFALVILRILSGVIS